MNPVSSELIKSCIGYFEENTTKINKCLKGLSEEQVWLKPNDSSNSIGNLMLHLCGNITQYVISSLGHQQDTRERDLEFTETGGHSKSALILLLNDTVTKATSIMKSVDDHELVEVRKVQAYHLSGVHILIHVTEHFSYHTGQIAFWTKELLNKDLGFYDGVNLNEKG